MNFIKTGSADVMLAGGSEACIHPLAFPAFEFVLVVLEQPDDFHDLFQDGMARDWDVAVGCDWHIVGLMWQDAVVMRVVVKAGSIDEPTDLYAIYMVQTFVAKKKKAWFGKHLKALSSLKEWLADAQTLKQQHMVLHHQKNTLERTSSGRSNRIITLRIPSSSGITPASPTPHCQSSNTPLESSPTAHPPASTPPPASPKSHAPHQHQPHYSSHSCHSHHSR